MKLGGGGISVIEELIIQAKELAAFHPNSVNTIRMPVVKSKDSKTLTIFHPFFRMGRGHSIVDNGGAGGIFACVDVESGIINTEGVDEFSDNEYIFHPDTHYQIVGFKIPRWDEAIELAKEASCQTTNRYTGWDLALTEQGWVIVEGNECGQFIAQQIGKGGQLDELLHLIEQ
jgi:hypothetical protein